MSQLPESANLRNSAEFRVVYAGGKRYEGRFMTVFVLSNGLNRHRLGITASRKMAKSAVDRNRAKRLLRESFRLSSVELEGLQHKCDWIFNARRSLLEVKTPVPFNEFQEIINRIMLFECRISGESHI